MADEIQCITSLVRHLPMDIHRGYRFATWNVASLTGRSSEVIDVLYRRRIVICFVQEVRWKGSGIKMLRQKVKDNVEW